MLYSEALKYGMMFGGFLALCTVLYWIYRRGVDKGRQAGINEAQEAHDKAQKDLSDNLYRMPDSIDDHFRVRKPGMWGKTGKT